MSPSCSDAPRGISGEAGERRLSTATKTENSRRAGIQREETVGRLRCPDDAPTGASGASRPCPGPECAPTQGTRDERDGSTTRSWTPDACHRRAISVPAQGTEQSEHDGGRGKRVGIRVVLTSTPRPAIHASMSGWVWLSILTCKRRFKGPPPPTAL